MKAYKGFNKDLTCRGFQYEEGKTFETDEAELCKSGFHACERPLDVLSYYPPATSVYHVVELDEVENKRDGDNKVCAKKITVGAKLSIGDLVKAQVQYTRERCTTEYTDPSAATAGEYGAATAGYCGAATAGNRGAATAGEYGTAVSRGRSSVGANGLAVARGNNVQAKGGMGAILILAEEAEDSCAIIDWRVIVVDGKNIEPDTWYKLKNGELMEA